MAVPVSLRRARRAERGESAGQRRSWGRERWTDDARDERRRAGRARHARSVPFERRRDDGEAAIGPATGRVPRARTWSPGYRPCASGLNRKIWTPWCPSDRRELECVRNSEDQTRSRRSIQETTSAGADSQSFQFDEIVFASARLFARAKPKCSTGQSMGQSRSSRWRFHVREGPASSASDSARELWLNYTLV